jgi:hypothetical protein
MATSDSDYGTKFTVNLSEVELPEEDVQAIRSEITRLIVERIRERGITERSGRPPVVIYASDYYKAYGADGPEDSEDEPEEPDR